MILLSASMANVLSTLFLCCFCCQLKVSAAMQNLENRTCEFTFECASKITLKNRSTFVNIWWSYEKHLVAYYLNHTVVREKKCYTGTIGVKICIITCWRSSANTRSSAPGRVHIGTYSSRCVDVTAGPNNNLTRPRRSPTHALKRATDEQADRQTDEQRYEAYSEADAGREPAGDSE